MNLQQMKINALNLALKATDNRGIYEVANFDSSAKLVCNCFNLTDFSFGLFTKNIDGSYSANTLTLSEQATATFLIAVGIK